MISWAIRWSVTTQCINHIALFAVEPYFKITDTELTPANRISYEHRWIPPDNPMMASMSALWYHQSYSFHPEHLSGFRRIPNSKQNTIFEQNHKTRTICLLMYYVCVQQVRHILRIETSPGGTSVDLAYRKTRYGTWYIPEGMSAAEILAVPGAWKY